MDTKRPAISLEERRRSANIRTQRQALTQEERLTEMELSVDKLLETVLQQQGIIQEIEDRQWKLLRLIGKRLGITTSR